jgi:hypothetical protein
MSPAHESPALSPELTALLPGLSAEEVRRRLADALPCTDDGERDLALDLVIVAVAQLHRRSGLEGTAHYAQVVMGIERQRAEALLRAGCRLLELRQIDRAYCEGRLPWSDVLTLGVEALGLLVEPSRPGRASHRTVLGREASPRVRSTSAAGWQRHRRAPNVRHAPSATLSSP